MISYKHGDTVLIGRAQYVMPRDWVMARVAADMDGSFNIVFWHGGRVCTSPLCPADIRAIGSVRQLFYYKKACEKHLSPWVVSCETAEKMLQEARAAMWDELSELCEAVPYFAQKAAAAEAAPRNPLSHRGGSGPWRNWW